jgi:hypothetical protein|nr:MAG TPA: hypothetical protein [Caudoviricetes sp.]
MNKERLINQFDEKLQQLRDEFIAKLEDDKKEFELTYPENEEVVYLADSEVTLMHYDANDKVDKNIFEHGLYFKTREEAEQHLKERKLLLKLHQWAKIKNDGWEPDLNDRGENKYYIYYLQTEELLKISNVYSVRDFLKLPYFKSTEIARECINLFGEEIKEVLC